MLEQIIEALLFASGKAMSLTELQKLVSDGDPVDSAEIKQSIANLQQHYQARAINLVEVASGFRFQVQSNFSTWTERLWQTKAQKYSPAFLETLAIIAYRQPVTRGEIEAIRGVAVSSNIMRTLHEERNWVRIVGHKDVPGKPGLYATTKTFLDEFNLQSLTDLPEMPENSSSQD
ncbi:MAG: SMC-Scp complex subunit ScpB [Legionellales bacterium]|nr:MAG: SMC-Scp complex subunit ScpB [Legionellales bacterium]